MKKLVLATLFIIISAMAAAKPQQGMRNSSTDRPCLTGDSQTCYRTSDLTLPLGTLTQIEIDFLNHMREEEKLAHDVYLFLYQKWQYPIFLNIAESELQHTQTMSWLLSRYQLSDPATNLPAGQYNNPELQKLYEKFIREGSESLQKALIVGATIEDLDIFDLQKAQAETKQADILQAYQNLERGSQNHLRSFNRMLQRNGWQYQPQYISLEKFQQIIAGNNKNGR